MAFEIDTSHTSLAAKVAVLYRDKDKTGSGGLPDRLINELLAGAWAPGGEQPPAERHTIFTSSQELKSLFGMVADLRAAFAAPGSYGAPLATGPLSPLAPASPDPLDPTPYRGPDLRSTLTDIRALTHGRSASDLRAAATLGGLASVMAVVLDLKRATFGSGPRDTEAVGDWLSSSGADAELPFIGLGVLEALRQLAGRLKDAERRIGELESRT